MIRSFSRPLRLLLVVLAFGATVAAVPTAAQATVASSGTLTLLPRASWVSYIARFGGSIRALGTATLNGSNELSEVLGGLLTTTYETDLDDQSQGAGRLSYAGGIEYAVPSHGISVKLRDFSVVFVTQRDSAARVYALADYYPIGGSALTGYVLTQIATINAGASGVFAYTPGSPVRHSWTNAPLLLTTAGALVFNGGVNGSYRAGDQFGGLHLTASHP